MSFFPAMLLQIVALCATVLLCILPGSSACYERARRSGAVIWGYSGHPDSAEILGWFCILSCLGKLLIITFQRLSIRAYSLIFDEIWTKVEIASYITISGFVLIHFTVPDQWAQGFPSCGLSEQSPIDVQSSSTETPSFGPISVSYSTPTDLTVINNGHTGFFFFFFSLFFFC